MRMQCKAREETTSRLTLPTDVCQNPELHPHVHRNLPPPLLCQLVIFGRISLVGYLGQ